MSKWREWKNNLGEARPWHLLDPDKKITDQRVVSSRMDMCRSCEHFISLTSQCSQCGCYMPAKTTLSNAECPIGRWHKES